MNYDDKQIGRNIKAIRNANGMSTIDFASYIKLEDKEEGISNSLLEKIENGKRHASDEIIDSIARHTGFSFSEIKYGDLTHLKKNERVFSDSIHFFDFLLDKENLASWKECFQHFFPVAHSEEAMKSENFQKGMKILKEKIESLNFTIEECLEAISSFEKSISDGVDALASINILSCSGYLYLKMSSESISDDLISEISNEKIRCDAEFFSPIRDMVNDSPYEQKRKEFIKEYDSLLERHMRRLAADKEYSDYAYYFLYIRYELGLFDEKTIRIDISQMKRFSEAFFDSLWKIGNRYAVILHDYLEEQKNI